MKSKFASLIKQTEYRRDERKLSEAYTYYHEAVKLNPKNDTAWHNLGLAALDLGDINFAIKCISQAVLINQSQYIYLRNLGELYRRAGLPDQAVTLIKTATQLAPKDTESYYNLALAYTDSGDEKKAIKSYRKALEINPSHGNAWNNLGSLLEKTGHHKSAKSAYEKAIQLNPKNSEAQNNLGAIFLLEGNLKEAKQAFEHSLKSQPKFITAHFNLSALKTYTADDPQLRDLLNLEKHIKAVETHEQVQFYFALGKALEDTKKYKESFDAYCKGNELQYQLNPVDENSADKFVDNIISTYSQDFFAERKSWAVSSKQKKNPIFIIGMPRSGTSLLEQIIATHPRIFGAGELSTLPNISNEILQGYGSAELAPKSAYDLIGNRYLNEIWKLSPQSDFVSDKMPANFMQLGLIYLSMPNARIIHSIRDPMDSCFSCFARHFQKGMEFTYSLDSLARYYKRYTKLMNHWKKVLPESFILDVRYEELVKNTEQQSRKILEFIGVEWDPNCLEFHKSERVTKTASMAQVKKPIYKTSIARWSHFSKELNSLSNQLKECI